MIDNGLIKNCQAGNPKSQRLLYNETAPLIMAICRRYCPSPADAEDLFQEIFVKIFTKIGDYQFLGSFEGWIRRIAVTQAINRFRQIKRIVDSIDEEGMENTLSVHDNYLQLMSEEEMIQMVSDLPNGAREVFNLFAIEGWSHEQIAEHLGFSNTSSRTQFFRAKKILKERIEAKFGKEEVKLYVNGK